MTQISDLTRPFTPQNAVLMRKAVELESHFLSEMLRHIGSSPQSEQFGGGIGEDQMTSFLRQAQADAIAKAGGIGLAEHLFRALQERQDAAR